METRRNFIKKAALASGALGLAGIFPESIQKALAIDPGTGTTWKDAEHVVILMQENRSFDHCYGMLQGVRGYNDPRAITLPNGNPVFLQTNKAGETYAPFRLNIKDTRATWMGSLPHSWTDQVDARNDGKMDRWLETKASGHPPFAKMPLTMGYYNREDLPFYYSLADAFTVCDQNFCSSLTGTTPNRLYLWTGTIREKADEDSFARVNNEDADHDTNVSWQTFPERLEANGISWKIYQNDVSVGTGIVGEEDSWLSNFGDNAIEYFSQYQVRFLPAYIKALPERIAALKKDIVSREAAVVPAADVERSSATLKYRKDLLAKLLVEEKNYTAENYAKLSAHEKSIHEKAFTTNTGDADYHKLEALTYKHEGKSVSVNIPKGDIFHQFRSDVKTGNLPAVSWLVAPENLSDHPTSPWYGAAYVSEAMDILTSNPEVWKKTIFILCYDENDGYFDHVAPFTAPHPGKPETGFTTKGIDTRVDFVKLEQDKKWKRPEYARESSIGLGYRVPLVIASPWSRGGAVNSQVFDHTSMIQFIEKLFTAKTGKKIEEPNISAWRRTVCGDLTSVFTPWNGEKVATPTYLNKPKFYESVHQAQFKNDPGNFRALNDADIKAVRTSARTTSILTRQESGTRTSRALPYELYSDGKLSADKGQFQIKMAAGSKAFGAASAGSPFNVYAYGFGSEVVLARAYAVEAGDELTDHWPLTNFDQGRYHLKVYGPNGFFREFKGSSSDPDINVTCSYEPKGNGLSGDLILTLANLGKEPLDVVIGDQSYNSEPRLIKLKPTQSNSLVISTKPGSGWYDIAVQTKNASSFLKRFAGRVETGKEGITDPAMAHLR